MPSGQRDFINQAEHAEKKLHEVQSCRQPILRGSPYRAPNRESMAGRELGKRPSVRIRSGKKYRGGWRDAQVVHHLPDGVRFIPGSARTDIPASRTLHELKSRAVLNQSA